VGAYQPGSNQELDRAVQLRELLTAFMRQDPMQPVGSQQAIEGLSAIFGRA
jgi:flagellar biosynthesis/type III secretory pathway ATPase